MGWRYLMFTLGSITLGIFFLRFVVFNFKESPKFLVYRGNDAKAIEVLQHVAKVNKRECGVTLADFEALTAEDASTNSGTELFGSGDKQRTLSLLQKVKLEFVRYGMLFKGWQMARLTLLVWLIYICDFWGFSLAGEFDVMHWPFNNCTNDPYRLLLAIDFRSEKWRAWTFYRDNLPQLSGHLHSRYRRRCAWLYDVQGAHLRSSSDDAHFRCTHGCFDICLLGSKQSTCQHRPQHDGIVSIHHPIPSTQVARLTDTPLSFFQSMFNAVLYGWTPEVFPAPVRGTGSGLASFWGRLFGIIAPLTAQSLLPPGGVSADPTGAQKVLYLAGGVTLGAVLGIALLPRKQLGKQSF